MQHNECVFVIVKDFSKWIELVSLLNTSNERATYTFLDQLLS
jgi:hypothetical protein